MSCRNSVGLHQSCPCWLLPFTPQHDMALHVSLIISFLNPMHAPLCYGLSFPVYLPIIFLCSSQVQALRSAIHTHGKACRCGVCRARATAARPRNEAGRGAFSNMVWHRDLADFSHCQASLAPLCLRFLI